MSPIGKDELERIIREMEPAEVEARYGAQLDPEARAFFDGFLETCARLDSLSNDMAMGMPPVPDVVRTAKVIPFYQRKVSLPAWSLPLAVAACLTLGFILPGSMPPSDSGLTITRNESVDTPQQDARISDAFFERGQYFQGKGRHEMAWKDFRVAYDFLPEKNSHQRGVIVEELRIVAEQLKDQSRLKEVEALEANQKASEPNY